MGRDVSSSMTLIQPPPMRSEIRLKMMVEMTVAVGPENTMTRPNRPYWRNTKVPLSFQPAPTMSLTKPSTFSTVPELSAMDQMMSTATMNMTQTHRKNTSDSFSTD